MCASPCSAQAYKPEGEPNHNTWNNNKVNPGFFSPAPLCRRGESGHAHACWAKVYNGCKGVKERREARKENDAMRAKCARHASPFP